LFERVGEHVAIVRLNRPEVRNAVNAKMAADIHRLVNEIEADTAIRVGIFSGTGAMFCAGSDLKEISAGRDIRVPRLGGFAGFTQTSRRKPWIAAVNGSALGGGTEIML